MDLLPHFVWSGVGKYPEEHFVQTTGKSTHVPHVDRVDLQSIENVISLMTWLIFFKKYKF